MSKLSLKHQLKNEAKFYHRISFHKNSASTEKNKKEKYENLKTEKRPFIFCPGASDAFHHPTMAQIFK